MCAFTCWLLSSGLPSSASAMADSPAAIAPCRLALPPACNMCCLLTLHSRSPLQRVTVAVMLVQERAVSRASTASYIGLSSSDTVMGQVVSLPSPAESAGPARGGAGLARGGCSGRLPPQGGCVRASPGPLTRRHRTSMAAADATDQRPSTLQKHFWHLLSLRLPLMLSLLLGLKRAARHCCCLQTCDRCRCRCWGAD